YRAHDVEREGPVGRAGGGGHGTRAPRARRLALRGAVRPPRRPGDRPTPRAVLAARALRPATSAVVQDVRARGQGVRGRGRDTARDGGGMMARSRTISAALIGVLFPPALVSGESLELAWRRDNVADYVRLVSPAADQITATTPQTTPLDARLDTALGSIWKLFVYIHLTERDLTVPDYTCDGSVPKDEAFCCVPGGAIGADEALAR